MFRSKRNQSCIVNQMAGFYAILNIDKNRLNSIFFRNSLMHIIGIKFCAFYFSHIRAEEVQNIHTTVTNFNAKHSAVVNKI